MREDMSVAAGTHRACKISKNSKWRCGIAIELGMIHGCIQNSLKFLSLQRYQVKMKELKSDCILSRSFNGNHERCTILEQYKRAQPKYTLSIPPTLNLPEWQVMKMQ
jgi:hypothetical protein